MIAAIVIVVAFALDVALVLAIAHYLPPRVRRRRTRGRGRRAQAGFIAPRWWARPLVTTHAHQHQVRALLSERWRYPEER